MDLAFTGYKHKKNKTTNFGGSLGIAPKYRFYVNWMKAKRTIYFFSKVFYRSANVVIILQKKIELIKNLVLSL